MPSTTANIIPKQSLAWIKLERLAPYMGNCQIGPFLGTLNIRCRIIRGIQKGTIILTTTHIASRL